MPRWMYGLLIFVPAAVAASLLQWSPVITFALSALAIIPLAGLIGAATENLAKQLGPKLGGLLNATFGNATELIVSLLAIQHGLLTLVKASLTGSIISNTLFIFGFAALLGGLKHGGQSFDPRRATTNAAMKMLALVGLYLPAAFTLTVQNSNVIEELSLLVAGVLLLTYILYLLYTVFWTAKSDTGNKSERTQAKPPSNEQKSAWSVPKSLIILAVTIVVAGIMSELLVNTVEATAKSLGWTEFFVGIIIVPFIGNAAEHYSALKFALNNQMEGALSIVSSSGMQIALLAAPLLVFASYLLGHPMNLIFQPLELLILGLAIAIFGFINLDGRSNWLEGVQLLGVFLIAAVTFFFLPVQ